ncbi:MerC domain-containing protein [Arundinibacter roseus]|uniref:MerC domain-containing protein n=1 Tax=Arundinibacter roseus TaxID=2070510 RepID=A0A4R4KBI2_9BACT|nr:MerC domain-containing protein [Arundinibacter roseus]TDB64036.1 MerC domain-containing protein [Arundinibacter roseus]
MKTNSTIHTKEHTHGKADYVGIAGSVMCLIHCLITPALAIGSSYSMDHQHAAGGISFDYFFILINGLAVYYASRDHQLPALRAFMWGAFALFSVSILLENKHVLFEILGYVGSFLLIGGHMYNLFYCRPWLFGKRTS